MALPMLCYMLCVILIIKTKFDGVNMLFRQLSKYG